MNVLLSKMMLFGLDFGLLSLFYLAVDRHLSICAIKAYCQVTGTIVHHEKSLISLSLSLSMRALRSRLRQVSNQPINIHITLPTNKA